MKIHIDITEAEQRFLEIIHAATCGELIIITKDTHPVVQIIATSETKKRPVFGSAKGMITMSDDFDAPLEDFHEYVS